MDQNKDDIIEKLRKENTALHLKVNELTTELESLRLLVESLHQEEEERQKFENLFIENIESARFVLPEVDHFDGGFIVNEDKNIICVSSTPYHSSFTKNKPRLLEVNLNERKIIKTLELSKDDLLLRCAIKDPKGNYGYFGSIRGIIKVDLIQMKRVGFLEVTGIRSINTAFTDGHYAYFGAEENLVESISSQNLADDSPTNSSHKLGQDKRKKRKRLGRVIRVTISEKLEISSTIHLSGIPTCSVVDINKGIGYFGLDSGVIAKVKLASFNAADEETVVSGKPSVLTLNGDFLYVGFSDYGSVLKMDLNNNSLQEVELGIYPITGLLDDNGNVIHYISNGSDIAILDLHTFKTGRKILEGDGEETKWATIIKNDGAFYFADGAEIVKVPGLSIFMSLFSEQ